MIIFQHVRRRRLSVRPTELTLGDGIALAKLPVDRNEAATTELLRRIAKDADAPRPGFVTDPLLMTVQERALLVSIYMGQTTTDGPNFVVSAETNGRLLDYLTLDADSTLDETSVGTPVKQEMVVRHLLGVHAQAIEAMCETPGDWTLCAMACQMFRKDDPGPDWLAMSTQQLREWIQQRAEVFMGMPESDFDPHFAAWHEGRQRLAHFVDFDFVVDSEGKVAITFLPKAVEGGADAKHPPARFLANSAISQISRLLS